MDGTTNDDAERAAVRRNAANGRTYLAWNRTALTWGGVGVVYARYAAPRGLVSAATITGVAMVLCSAVLWLIGMLRYRRRERWLVSGGPRPSTGSWLGVATAAVVATTGVAFVAELIR